MSSKRPPMPPSREAHSPRLSRSVQAELGRRLRHFYDTAKNEDEPVPARFAEIIDRLDRAAVRESKA